MWSYVRRNAVSIFRIYAQYEPLRVFWRWRRSCSARGGRRLGALPRRLIGGDGAGHVQSLILGAVLFNAAVVLAALGVIGDLLYAQRMMSQRIFERVRRDRAAARHPAVALRARARAATGQPADHRRRTPASGTEEREALRL